MMSYARLTSLALTIAPTPGHLAASPGWTQLEPPPNFTFDKSKDSPGSVTFSHEKHMAAENKSTSCHVKIFKLKKRQTGPLTMEKMKAGEQCGGCHNGKTEVAGKIPFTVDANCEKSHR